MRHYPRPAGPALASVVRPIGDQWPKGDPCNDGEAENEGLLLA